MRDMNSLKEELGLEYLNCYCTPSSKPDRRSLQSWIRFKKTSLQLQLRPKGANPPAFKIKDTPTHILDPFHMPEQLASLQEEEVWPTRRTADQLHGLLNRLDPSGLDFRSVHLEPPFPLNELLTCLEMVKGRQKRGHEIKMRLGGQKAQRLARLDLILKLKQATNDLLASTTWSLRKLANELRVPLSFLKQCVSAAKDDMQVAEEKQSLLKELEERNQLNDDFLDFFCRNQMTLRTRKLLWNSFKKQVAMSNRSSLSSFDRHFLRANKLTCQKVKITWDLRRFELRTMCRLHILERILESVDKGHDLLFFDESSFQIDPSNTHAFGFTGQRPTVRTSHSSGFFHLLMVTSLEGVQAFLLTAQKVTISVVSSFLERLLRERSRHLIFSRRPVVLVMDNAPKNRSNEIKQMANSGRVNLLYTAPCSPFLNQIESVFGLIKRAVRNRPDALTR